MRPTTLATRLAIWAVLMCGTPAIGQQFERERLFSPDDWAFQDNFGECLDVCGSWLVVGERNDNDAGQGEWNIGKAHIFRRFSTGWVHDQQFEGSDSATSDQFGESVAIQGETVFVGAREHNVIGSSSGAVYVFEYNGVKWKEIQKLVPSDAKQGDNFGASLAVDGSYLVIGAFGLDDVQQNGGGAYLYENQNGVWTQSAKWTPMTTGLAGVSVALSGDVAVVGAPTGAIGGEAIVYERQADGTWAAAWGLRDPTGRLFDDVGRAVAVEGDLIVVGENAGYPASPPRVGSAFVWERIGGQWVLQQELQASNGEVYGSACCKSGDLFGWSVAIDGGRIFAGATNNRELGDHMGSAYVFERDATGTWVEVERFLPSRLNDSSFGSYLTATQGELLVGSIGAWAGDNIDGDIAGAVYVYDLPLGTPYCTAQPNSTGSPAAISATGYGSAVVGDLTLTASQLPMNVFGYFLNSDVQGFTPFPPGSSGNLCLAGGIGRHAKQIANSGSAGELVIDVDLTSLPRPSGTHSVVAGETWNFQCWFRDKNPGPTSNFSDGLAVTFQ